MGLLIKPEGLKGIQMTLMNLHHIGISCKSTLLYWKGRIFQNAALRERQMSFCSLNAPLIS